MIATVTKTRQVRLPADVCDELGITPGARLDFRARKGKLEAVKVSRRAAATVAGSTKHLYTEERNAEELAIQKGCSCEVPEDFPR
jgi:bifunctional DNA-binding transcriptional regulator/antitoxin component of YhaV-PrlF toxin-antitoxin module